MTALYQPLSNREKQVLAELSRHKSNVEIAESLYITEGTVKTHVRHLLQKFGVASRGQIISKAYELGLLGQPLERRAEPVSILIKELVHRSMPPEECRRVLAKAYDQEVIDLAFSISETDNYEWKFTYNRA